MSPHRSRLARLRKLGRNQALARGCIVFSDLAMLSCGLIRISTGCSRYLGVVDALGHQGAKGEGGQGGGRHHQAPGRVSASLRHHAVGFAGNCLTVRLFDCLTA